MASRLGQSAPRAASALDFKPSPPPPLLPTETPFMYNQRLGVRIASSTSLSPTRWKESHMTSNAPTRGHEAPHDPWQARRGSNDEDEHGSRSLSVSPFRKKPGSRAAIAAGFQSPLPTGAVYSPLTEAEYDGKGINFRALSSSPNAAARGIGGGLDWLKEPPRDGSFARTPKAGARPRYDWRYEGDVTPPRFIAFQDTAWQTEGNFPSRR